jgi:hypothetical protein
MLEFGGGIVMKLNCEMILWWSADAWYLPDFQPDDYVERHSIPIPEAPLAFAQGKRIQKNMTNPCAFESLRLCVFALKSFFGIHLREL